LKHSDDVCTLELGRLTANEAITNSSLSILNTGLSTASTIVGGNLAKTILSGGAAFIGASRDHINVHVYRNTIAQAVSQVIASERKTLATDIRNRYSSEVSDWTIDDAVRAVNVYHGQCSFYKGLELLLKAADNNTDLQAFRSARLQQSQMARLDQEIRSLEARTAATTDAASKAKLEARVTELLLARSKLGTGSGVPDEDTAGTSETVAPAPTPEPAGGTSAEGPNK
jgi:hypothetical protein